MSWYNTNTQSKKAEEPERFIRPMMATLRMEANPESVIKDAEKEENPKKAKSKPKPKKKEDE